MPVTVPAGALIAQKVTVRLRGAPPRPSREFVPPWIAPAEVRLTIGERLDVKLPAIGCIWNAPEATERAINSMRDLGLAHLRVDLCLARPEHVAALRAAAEAAVALDVALELAVFIGDDSAARLAGLRQTLAALRCTPRVARWIVYHEAKSFTPPECVIAVRNEFAGTKFAAPIGGGATENFTELNRHRAVIAVGDFTAYACNPQVHAFDDTSLFHTLPIQGLTVSEARRISCDRLVVVSPVTLTRRKRKGEPGTSETFVGLPPLQTDPRHSQSFCAAWTLASIAALASAGAASVTYFETTGDNGLLDGGGRKRPVAKIFRLLAPLRDKQLRHVRASHPQVTAVIVELEKGYRVLLANLSRGTQRVRVAGPLGSRSALLAAHGVHAMQFGSG